MSPANLLVWSPQSRRTKPCLPGATRFFPSPDDDDFESDLDDFDPDADDFPLPGDFEDDEEVEPEYGDFWLDPLERED